MFLELNGLEIAANEDEFANLVLEVAQGRAGKPVIAEYLRKHAG